jgi:hypothetical protein
VGPRDSLDVRRRETFLAYAGVQTLDRPARNLIQDTDYNILVRTWNDRFFSVTGPLADGTDATQPEGFLHSPVIKMVNQMMKFFNFSILMENRCNGIDRGKPKYSGKNLSRTIFFFQWLDSPLGS